jgi:hypothetical protein
MNDDSKVSITALGKKLDLLSLEAKNGHVKHLRAEVEQLHCRIAVLRAALEDIRDMKPQHADSPYYFASVVSGIAADALRGEEKQSDD